MNGSGQSSEVQRDDAVFDVDGTECAAWWYTPQDAEPPYPALVMAHGFGGTRSAGLDPFAHRFAQAGIAALVFDYRNFGDSGGSERQVLDIGMQLEDWRAAVAYVRGRDDTDEARIALWGTSFSGGHVLELAAEDHDLAAVVSQVPFVDGVANLRMGPASPRTMLGLLGAGAVDAVGALLGRPPLLVPVVGSRGSVAFMTTPDAEDGYRALLPLHGEVDDRVAARIALRVSGYRPGRRAAEITCPLLVCVADEDSVAAPEAAVAAAEQAPRGKLMRYPCRHFEVYVGDWFERVVADEATFLTEHLGL